MKKRSGKTVRTGGRARKRTSGSKRGPEDAFNCVFLVGFMGAGKTSIGQALGALLNWEFEDLDDRIERREGQSVSEIFRDFGEEKFRETERTALKQLLNELQGAAKVIALGGGAFVQQENALLLERTGMPTVFLDAPVEELWRRCSEQARALGETRPLVSDFEQFRKRYENRRQRYAKASVTIQTGNRPVEKIAAEIVESLGLKKIAMRVEQGEAE